MHLSENFIQRMVSRCDITRRATEKWHPERRPMVLVPSFPP